MAVIDNKDCLIYQKSVIGFMRWLPSLSGGGRRKYIIYRVILIKEWCWGEMLPLKFYLVKSKQLLVVKTLFPNINTGFYHTGCDAILASYKVNWKTSRIRRNNCLMETCWYGTLCGHCRRRVTGNQQACANHHIAYQANGVTTFFRRLHKNLSDI